MEVIIIIKKYHMLLWMEYLISLVFLILSCSCSNNLSNNVSCSSSLNVEVNKYCEFQELIKTPPCYKFNRTKYELTPTIWVEYPIFYSQIMDDDIDKLNSFIENMALEYMDFPREINAEGEYRVIFDVKCSSRKFISIFITSFSY